MLTPSSRYVADVRPGGCTDCIQDIESRLRNFLVSWDGELTCYRLAVNDDQMRPDGATDTSTKGQRHTI